MSKKGGHPVDEFVFKHFTAVGEKTKAKQWNMRWKYCAMNSKIIVHCDSRCLQHLAETGDGACSHAPKEVREEAQRRFMVKGGIEIPEPPSDHGGDNDTEIIVGEARTSNDGAEKNIANVCMLRFFIHGNIPFAAAENHFGLKWIHSLRPSYTPATRYMLMEQYLPAEEDLTGMRATADNLVEVTHRALEKMSIKPTLFIAVCTNNPTAMQAFRKKWIANHIWIIPLACFMHGINTIIGKVVAFPSAKAAVSKNSQIVTFFNVLLLGRTA
ncbi:hypothetical protein B0H34DRAFT_676906 [Crassisporium funariophilum]|nr:hypothetical protein B0H34DRAFT_676906 [Crassisporium funariophilum]